MLNTQTTNSELRTAKRLRVAIVHDWLVGGGAEKVVEQLHQLYPEAPIYTSYATDKWRKKLDDKVITGYLSRWPFSRLRKFLPVLRGLWFSHLKFDDFDLVISSSGAEAKFIKVGRQGLVDSRWAKLKNLFYKNTFRTQTTNYKLQAAKPLHVAYIHAPTHYYWSRYDEYMASPGFGKFDWLARIGLKLLVGPMRKWDYRMAQRPDYLVANSTHTKNEIKKYYGRDSRVIFPPVDVERFSIKSDEARIGYVIAGRQTPYKRFDLAVMACSQLKLPLIVIGRGPDHFRLKRLAGRSVIFLRNVSDEEMPRRFAEAKGFIFPGIDDFGITPVEALAAGTPVIAFKGGGALDYVTPGKTGVFFAEQTVDSLVDALQKFEKSKFNHQAVASSAKQFSAQNFRSNISKYIKEHKSKAND